LATITWTAPMMVAVPSVAMNALTFSFDDDEAVDQADDDPAPPPRDRGPHVPVVLLHQDGGDHRGEVDDRADGQVKHPGRERHDDGDAEDGPIAWDDATVSTVTSSGTGAVSRCRT